MNKRQENKLHMFNATLSYLEEHAIVYSGVNKIGEAKNAFKSLVSNINDEVLVQEQANSTIGMTKLSLKKQIALKADELNDLVEVYATFNGNDELARQMSDSKSDLLHLSYDKLILKASGIIEKLIELKEELIAEYGLTESDITGLQDDIDRLLELSNLPIMYQIKKRVATGNLEDLFAEADAVLNDKLDNLFKLFNRRDPSFYAGYLTARIIVG